MRKFRIPVIVLSAVLAAGMMVGCSSKDNEESSAVSIESEVVESTETNESTEENKESDVIEESSEGTEEGMELELTVAEVSGIAEDGTLDLILYGLMDAEGEAASESEDISGTSEVVESEAESKEGEAESGNAESEENAAESANAEASGEEPAAEVPAFDFAAMDFSSYVTTDMVEVFQPDNSELVWLAAEDALLETEITDIQVGDMVVMFEDENGMINIVIYPGTVNQEAE